MKAALKVCITESADNIARVNISVAIIPIKTAHIALSPVVQGTATTKKCKYAGFTSEDATTSLTDVQKLMPAVGNSLLYNAVTV